MERKDESSAEQLAQRISSNSAKELLTEPDKYGRRRRIVSTTYSMPPSSRASAMRDVQSIPSVDAGLSAPRGMSSPIGGLPLAQDFGTLPQSPAARPEDRAPNLRGSVSGGSRGVDAMQAHLEAIRSRMPEHVPQSFVNTAAPHLANLSYLGADKAVDRVMERIARGGRMTGLGPELAVAEERAVGSLTKPGEKGGGQQQVTTETGKAGYKEALKKAGGKRGTRRRQRRAGDVEAASGQRVRATRDGGTSGSESGEVTSYNVRDLMTPERMRAIQRAGGAGGVVMPDELMRELAGSMTPQREERPVDPRYTREAALAAGQEDINRNLTAAERRARLDAAYEANKAKKKKGKS